MLNIRELDYVYDPATISIKVEYVPQQSANRIIFFVEEARAFEKTYRASPSSEKKDFNEFVKYCCELFFNHLAERDFVDAMSPSNYLKGKYIYKTIRKARAKSGYTIWTR